ncbi:MAG: 30S ribosomal protein S15 [Spirochaetaceae bacterium]|nr:30S ribosomal protein S15 [Spirochaetaceae bacterium]
MLSKELKEEIIVKFGGSEANTGSSQVQVALLTARINDLQDHFRANKKDHASRRGLLQMIGQRRRLLRYLKNNDLEAYRALILELGLRK